MKKIILLMTLVLVFSAHAELLVDVTPIDDTIYLDEDATFDISIGNPDNVNKVIQVYTPSIEWYANLEPFVTSLGPNETVEAVLALTPSVWAETGAQKISVYVESTRPDDKVLIDIPVFVKSFDSGDREYRPSVELSVDFPEEVDPREEIPVNIYMRNRNRLNITRMELVVESSIFYEKMELSLGPLAERREKIFFDIDPLSSPMDDSLEVRISVNNRSVNIERSDYQIIRYSTFVQNIDTIEEPFKKSTEYVIKNDGNVQKLEFFRVPTSFLSRFFTTAEPEPDKVVLGRNSYFEWTLNLEPQEEATINANVNYRPMIYVVLISIVILLIYFLYRSPVTVRKESIVTGSSEQGVSEMKVLLHVRNRSQYLVENITVTDLIPSMGQYLKEAHVGSLAPSKVLKHAKKGTIVKWEIDVLEPFEERIITYRIKSKIAIVGGITLPAAKVKFETQKGRERIVRSGRSQVSLGL